MTPLAGREGPVAEKERGVDASRAVADEMPCVRAAEPRRFDRRRFERAKLGQ
jgi:hypothetical protein